jgi:NAD+ synthase
LRIRRGSSNKHMLVSAHLADAIGDWIRGKAGEAGCKGVVLGISGGIDSAVTAALAARGQGSGAVTGIIMPCHSELADEEHAHLIVEKFGIKAERIDLGPAFDALMRTLPMGSGLAVANVKPRLRMLTLYYYANLHHLLVLGTSNRSELLAGYFTKYGDGGSDLMPLGGLLKREVRALAQLLGVPRVIVDKAPSGGLWAGQTDEGEMGISYDLLDRVLESLEAGDIGDLEPAVMTKVQRMITASQHKRRSIPTFDVESYRRSCVA